LTPKEVWAFLSGVALGGDNEMHLVALAGLAIGCAVFSSCANEGFTSYSGQQKALVKTNARDQGGVPSSWVDFSKDPRHQTGDTYPRGHKGLGTP
jgi:hypothetical protein